MPVRNRLPLLRRTAYVVVLSALAAPATAGAATAHAAAAKRLPTITKVTPTSVVAGTKLTLRGRNFVRGKGKNTVIFKAAGAKQVFAKADLATAKMLTVIVPKSLPFATKGGVAVPTRFSVRVLGKKLGKPFRTSPLVAPAATNAGTNPNGPAVTETCLSRGPDADGDLLDNALEIRLGLNPCAADSDGDGVSDGYEYQSAIDLNNDSYSNPQTSLPFPARRPYPNPLYADAGTDYDGDSLTLGEEYKLWRYTINAEGALNSLSSLTYSDGLKYSVYGRDGAGRKVPALATAGYAQATSFLNWATANGYRTVTLYDPATTHTPLHAAGDYDILDRNRNGAVSAAEGAWLDTHSTANTAGADGWLADDERDEDGDGLSNFMETHGGGLTSLWTGLYPLEGAFPTVFAVDALGTDLTNADTDGDGVLDGADDLDHDDVPNLMEASRYAIVGSAYLRNRSDTTIDNGLPPIGRVNMFNPCLPDRFSRTCPTYIPVNANYAPFNDAQTGLSETHYQVFN